MALIKTLCIGLCLYAIHYAGFTQEPALARISGQVTDKRTGEPLPGVNIVIKETYQGAVTGMDGKYSILIPKNTRILQFSFVGYVTEEKEPGTNRILDVALVPASKEIDEVVISAQAKGQAGARNQQINSNTLKNVVAPDRLQENPDANAVEAIGRLPGISVIRSGGEGAGLVIRGLEPRYTSVTINGIQMAATGGASRETNISGLSQYILQGVEVYKALTADMEGNSVAGTVNLQLKQIQEGLHYNLMLQGGYNHLNRYFGNYKVLGEVSNRLLDNRLGMYVSVNEERVNRSIQNMSAGYSTNTSTDLNINLESVSLNDIRSIKNRRSAMLALDYKITTSTTLSFYGIYNRSNDDHQRQSKNYSLNGAGSVGYNFYYSPVHEGDIWQSTLSGLTKTPFLNMELDYGAAFTRAVNNTPEGRDWNFSFYKASTVGNTTPEIRKLYPEEVIPLFHDLSDSIRNLIYNGQGIFSSAIDDNNLSGYVNAKVPFQVGKWFHGFIKFGGLLREKNRNQDDTRAGAGTFYWSWKDKEDIRRLPWIVPNGPELSAENMTDYSIDRFLNGKFHFGQHFSFDKLNELTDWWQSTTEKYLNDPVLLSTVMGGKEGLGYRYDLYSSVMNDQDIQEDYYSGYLMAEMNFDKWIMFLPGVRYEKSHASMTGFDILKPTLEPLTHDKLPLTGRDTTRNDEFLLPMVHLRARPVSWLYAHLSYTKTLSRPDFNMITPNTYINTGFLPYSFYTNNPALRAELWTNYDAQLTLHSGKIGLISVTGFQKTVKEKIWHRDYKRLKGDPVINPFPDAAPVNVSAWENHQYPVYLKGFEVEVQTAFWYLPKPFRFFTFTGNYTYTDSKTTYPLSWVENRQPPGGGRPVPVRVDTTYSGPMLMQPKHIINSSLGFNYKGLNIWLSYQYNGSIFTSKDPRLHEKDNFKEAFFRWDLQVTQKLGKRLKGFELLANVANLSDFMEKSRWYGDPRPTYLENYGWTFDLGLRYRY